MSRYQRLLLIILFVTGCYTPATAQALKADAMIPISLTTLETMAIAEKDDLWSKALAQNHSVKLYLHWSAAHYDEFFPDYHLNIAADGSIYAATTDLAEQKTHTYRVIAARSVLS